MARQAGTHKAARECAHATMRCEPSPGVCAHAQNKPKPKYAHTHARTHPPSKTVRRTRVRGVRGWYRAGGSRRQRGCLHSKRTGRAVVNERRPT